MKVAKLLTSLSLIAASLGLTAQAAIIEADPKLPAYVKATGVSGNISSIGSDTLNNLMTKWAEEFRKQYPNVNIQIQGAGSSYCSYRLN